MRVGAHQQIALMSGSCYPLSAAFTTMDRKGQSGQERPENRLGHSLKWSGTP